MFQVLAPIVILPSAEARAALRDHLRPAASAAWREIARRGTGIELAHFQIEYAGLTLALCSRLPRDGFIAIELGLGDPRQAARVIPAAQLRRAEAKLQARQGQAARRS